MLGWVRKKFLMTALVCLALALLFATAAPYLLRRRFATAEHSAAKDVQAINEAVKAYIAEHGTPPPALSSLKGRVEPALSCYTLSCDHMGYRFQYQTSSTPSGPTYSISAQPLSRETGTRSYSLNETVVPHR